MGLHHIVDEIEEEVTPEAMDELATQATTARLVGEILGSAMILKGKAIMLTIGTSWYQQKTSPRLKQNKQPRRS